MKKVKIKITKNSTIIPIITGEDCKGKERKVNLKKKKDRKVIILNSWTLCSFFGPKPNILNESKNKKNWWVDK